MDNQSHNQIVSFIWSIADDCLRDVYVLGTIFEELIRRFNEENDEEAGEHFTPRDVVELMADLIFKPVADKIKDTTYSVYELSFTKYFYKPVQLRPLAEIVADLKALEQETKGILDEILMEGGGQ
ncbi:Type I restriction-modification system methyltransferase subunit [Bacteroidales bacterium Barb6XT]|nr:Type I restriction-modification system methyltransferase subunit [Bacteroidales bacterium Barb6XT]